MGRIGPEEESRRDSFAYQKQFLMRAASEARDRAEAKVIKGPFTADFNSIFTNINGRLKKIDPELAYEVLLLDGFQSEETSVQVGGVNDFTKARLNTLRYERSQLIQKLALTKITQRLARQEIPDGLLVKPKFRRMPDANGKCTNASFRMVSSDILGWNMQEDFVEEAVLHGDRERVVPDIDYWNLLQTDAFRKEAGGSITVARFVGAGLDTITKVAGGVKELHPEARVYCVASIRGKDTDYKDTWHTVVLLKATQGGVFVHDPAWTEQGNIGENLAMQKSAFVNRWAAASNSGLFIVA